MSWPDIKLFNIAMVTTLLMSVAACTPKPSFKELENGNEYRVGKITIVPQSLAYRIRLNPKQLLDIAGKCGINDRSPDYELVVQDQLAIPERRRQMVLSTGGPLAYTNRSLAALICTAAEADYDKTMQITGKYERELLEGKAQPILDFEPKGQTF